MPNWCECDLYISGPPEDLQIFKEWARADNGEEALSPDNFIPYPEEFAGKDRFVEKKRDILAKIRKVIWAMPRAFTMNAWDAAGFNEEDGYNSGGYEWCLAHWGTKWPPYQTHLENDNGDELVYKFECAWSPCVGIILAMGQEFTTLRFDLRYFESGAGFNGKFVIEDGEVDYDECGKYFGRRGR